MNHFVPRSLVKRALPDIVELQPNKHGLRSWIEAGNFIVESGTSADEIFLKNINLREFIGYQAYDFERFSLASWETRKDVIVNRPRAISWPLLKIYYSGFFAGHAIMRSNGQAIIRIEAAQAKTLAQFGQLYHGSGFTVSSGTYDLRLSQGRSGTYDVTIKKAPEGRGAHEIFWKRMYSFLDELAADVSASKEVNALSIVSRIFELQRILSARGFTSGTWLSSVRNELNYQHQYGVWFPYGASQRDVTYVEKLGQPKSASIRLDYDPVKQPLLAFCSASMFLTALSFEISDTLVSQSSGRKRTFATTWRRLISELG